MIMILYMNIKDLSESRATVVGQEPRVLLTLFICQAQGIWPKRESVEQTFLSVLSLSDKNG
jgi:hypothetical protein